MALPLLLVGWAWLHGIPAVAQAQLLREVAPAGLQPLADSKAWCENSRKDAEVPLPYRARIKPEFLMVGPDHPNGFRFLAVFQNEGVYLPVRFDGHFHGFDDNGNLRPGYHVEVASHRFSPEGEPELIIAVGDERTELAINVLKYHAPKSRKEATRQANWIVEGSFLGQAQAWIKRDAIEFLADSSKPGKIYTYGQGKFIGEHD